MSYPPEIHAGVAALLPPRHAQLFVLAERDPRRAARLAAHWQAAGSPPMVATMFVLGWALVCWERPRAAEPWLKQAAALLERSGETALFRHCRYALLLCRQLDGAHPSLVAEWAAASEACLGSGDPAGAVRARCEQIACLNLLGRHREARDLAAAIDPLVQRHGTAGDRARYALVVGAAATGCGELGAAFASLDQAAALYRQLRRRLGLARVDFERAWAWQRSERYTEAAADLHRALAVFEPAGMALRVALCTKDLGLVAGRTGAYGAAIGYANRARGLFAALGRDDMVGRCDLNLGVVAYYSGLHELAAGAYRRAETVYRAVGDQRLQVIARRNQALVLLAQERYAAALAVLDASGPDTERLGDALEQAEWCAARGRALAGLSRSVAALECLHSARERFELLGALAAAAECRLDEGWLLLDCGMFGEAAAVFQAALAPLADRPGHRWRLHHGLAQVAAQSGDSAAALAHYHAATTLVATLRRAVGAAHASSGLFRLAQRLYDDAIRFAAARDDPAATLAFAERQRVLVLEQQYEASGDSTRLAAERDTWREQVRTLLVTEAAPERLDAAMTEYIGAILRARHARPAPSHTAAVFDIGVTRARLVAAYGDDWTVLTCILTEDTLLLLTLTPDDLTLDQVPRDESLRALLERACLPRYRLATYRDLARLQNPGAAAWQTLTELAQRLLPATLRRRLHPDHRLLIAPTGILHALPWAALRLGESWLCERAIVEYVPSFAAVPLEPACLAADAPALLIGCSRFGGRAPDLPGAIASLDMLQAQRRSPVTRLEGDAATCSALRRLANDGELSRFRLVHVASHAAHGGAYGLLGHIKLADGDLLVDDLLRLGLNDTLVVLAACDGAAGEVLAGDEVLSLSRSLVLAGASCVLAGLWAIHDRATLTILASFYRSLEQGNDAAVALNHAQRMMIGAVGEDGAAEITATPYAWAAFCLTHAHLVELPKAGGTTPAIGASGD
jgi:CHAT domain-containing protein/tetratricopeptide (TPR) repeat protein